MRNNKLVIMAMVAVMTVTMTVSGFAAGNWVGRQAINEANENVTKIEQLFEKKNETITTLEKAQGEYETLKIELEEKTNYIVELETNAKEDGEIIEAYYADIEKLTKSLDTANKDNEAKADKITDLKATLKGYILQIDEMTIKGNYYREQIEELKAEIKSLNNLIVDLEADIKAYDRQLAETQNQLGTANDDLSQALNDVLELNTRLENVIKENMED